MKAQFIAPELAILTENYFSDPNWIYEEKFDGFRCIAVRVKGKVSLFSRNHLSLNEEFPIIVQELEKKKGKDFVADGEIVAFKGKVTSFVKLQRRKMEKFEPFFFVFDLLLWDREDFRSLPLIERKQKLEKVFPFTPHVLYTPHVDEKGEAYYKKACQKGLEGIIAKRKNSPYTSRRTRDWLKFKCFNEQEFVIGGFTEPQGSRTAFGALLLGYYERGKLKYAGKVGTGFDTALLESLGKKMRRIEVKKNLFEKKPKENSAHFIKPQLVCEVGFTEWTTDGKLRHPRFLGLRFDKKAEEVRRERPK